MIREWAKTRKGQNPHSIRDPALADEEGELDDTEAEEGNKELPAPTPARGAVRSEENTASTFYALTSTSTHPGPSAHHGSPSPGQTFRNLERKSSAFTQTPPTSFSNTASSAGNGAPAKRHGKITKAGQASRLKKMAEKRKAKKDVEAERIKATAAAFADTVDRIPADGEGEGSDAGDDGAVEEERPRKRSKLTVKGSGETDVVEEQQRMEGGEVEEDQEGDDEDEDLEMDKDD